MRLKACLRGTCEYGKGEKKIEYYDYENQNYIPYECPRDSLPDKHYCEFHDSDYAQTNPVDVMKSFDTLVDNAVHNSEPLFCIGFYLPREVNLANKEFKNGVYFSHATFTEQANFLWAIFTTADFSYATFSKAADFSYAMFIKSANFLRATFSKASKLFLRYVH